VISGAVEHRSSQQLGKRKRGHEMRILNCSVGIQIRYEFYGNSINSPQCASPSVSPSVPVSRPFTNSMSGDRFSQLTMSNE
jgi:hypothetical protein